MHCFSLPPFALFHKKTKLRRLHHDSLTNWFLRTNLVKKSGFWSSIHCSAVLSVYFLCLQSLVQTATVTGGRSFSLDNAFMWLAADNLSGVMTLVKGNLGTLQAVCALHHCYDLLYSKKNMSTPSVEMIDANSKLLLTIIVCGLEDIPIQGLGRLAWAMAAAGDGQLLVLGTLILMVVAVKL